MAALCLAGGLLLAGCAGRHAGPTGDQAQQQALTRARSLCRDFGYTPGTMDFARCAQTEYDHMAVAAPAQPAAASASQPATAAQSSSDDDWLFNYMKQGPICGQTNCKAR